MDVRCEKCDTTYEFDESRVSDTGVNVKCSQCGNLFRVRRRSPFVTREMPGLRGVSAQLQAVAGPQNGPREPQHKERFWLLRLRYTQEVLRFRDLTTLRQWILDKRVTRDDDISRGGKAWRRLGSIVELESFFHAVEQAEIARLRTGKTGRVSVSAQSPSRGAPLAQEPQRLRTGTPGLGVGPPLISLPPRPRGPVEEGAPLVPMGLSSTGRTMRPRLQVGTPLGQAEAITVKQSAPQPVTVKQSAPQPITVKRSAPQPAVPDPAAPAPIQERPSGAIPRHIGTTSGPAQKRPIVFDVTRPVQPPAPARPSASAPALEDEKEAWLAAAEPVLTALAGAAMPAPGSRSLESSGSKRKPSEKPLAPLRPKAPEIPAALWGQTVIRSVRADPTPAAIITLVSDDPSLPQQLPPPDLPQALLVPPVVARAPETAAASEVAESPPHRSSFPEIEEAILRSDPVPRHLQEARHEQREDGPRAERTGPGETEFIEPVASLRRLRGGLLLAVAAVGLLTFAGVYLYLGRRAGPLAGAERAAGHGRGTAAYAEGRRLFLQDTDEGFQKAHDQLERAVGADEHDSRPLSLLAELHATWAHYLRDDASGAAPALGQRLRHEAQLQIESARTYAAQAQALGPGDREVNRALGAVLLAQGAPASQVEQALQRAEVGAPADAEMLYLRALLELREGRIDNARAVLTQVVSGREPAPLRVLLLLGQLEAAAGQTEAAQQRFAQVLERNQAHRRAQDAMKALAHAKVPAADGGAAPEAAVDAAPEAKPEAAPETKVQAPPAAPPEAAPPPDFHHQLAQAQRLLDQDRPREAQRLYQKLLSGHREAPEVHVGLGVCALDTEHFMEAIGHYKDALSRQVDHPAAMIGLAEAYKLHGDRTQALEWYKTYLDRYPGGTYARMVSNNIARLSTEDEK